MSFLSDLAPRRVRRALARTKSSFPLGLGLNASETTFGKVRPGDYQAMVDAYYSWTYAAASQIAASFMAIEWSLYVPTPEGDADVEQHPFLELMEEPNEHMTWPDIMNLADVGLELTGNAYLAKQRDALGVVRELWPLLPQFVKVVPDRTDFIRGYIYQVGSEKVAFEAQDVVHLKYPNPKSLYYGQGPVEANRYGVDYNELAKRFGIATLNNRAVPGGIASFPGNLPPEERKALRQEWEEMHRGPQNAARLAILTRGADFKTVTVSPEDLQYLQMNQFTRDETFAIFGISRAKVGMSDDINRANAEAADFTYQRDCIRPRLVIVRAQLQQKLIREYDPRLRLRFTDPVPEDKEYRLKEATEGAKAGILTINRAAERLGEEATVAGENYLWPFTSVTQPPDQDPAAPQEPTSVPAPAGAAAPDARVTSAILSEVRAIQVEDIYDPLAEVARMRELIAGMIGRALGLGITAAKQILDIDVDFTIDSPRALELLRTQASRFARDVTSTTMNALREALAEGAAQGETTAELADRIRDIYGLAREWRAPIAARSETGQAYGAAQYETYRAAGVNGKSWLTAGDERVEEVCADNEAAGVIAFNEAFPSGDDGAPTADHPNCRCVTVPEILEEAALNIEAKADKRKRLRGRADKDLASTRTRTLRVLRQAWREEQQRVLAALGAGT